MGTLSQNGYGAHNSKQKYNNDGVSQRLKRGKSEISAQGSARIIESMASLGGPTRNKDKPSDRQKKKAKSNRGSTGKISADRNTRATLMLTVPG